MKVGIYQPIDYKLCLIACPPETCNCAIARNPIMFSWDFVRKFAQDAELVQQDTREDEQLEFDFGT